MHRVAAAAGSLNSPLANFRGERVLGPLRDRLQQDGRQFVRHFELNEMTSASGPDRSHDGLAFPDRGLCLAQATAGATRQRVRPARPDPYRARPRDDRCQVHPNSGRTCRSGLLIHVSDAAINDESAKCSGSSQLVPPSGFSVCTPPSTTPSIFNAISSRARRSGSSEPRRQTNGAMRSRPCDRSSGLGLSCSPQVKLTMPGRLIGRNVPPINL